MAGRFALDLSRFVQHARGNARLVVKKVVLDLGSSIVMKTPVGDPDTWLMPAPPGYVGGRARGSWQYQKGTPAEGEPGGVDAGGGSSIGRIMAGVASGDAAAVHYITSNVPYMRELEYEGHSKQAPAGMVRVSVVEFQSHVDRAARSLP